jgi:hypothetical protein
LLLSLTMTSLRQSVAFAAQCCRGDLDADNGRGGGNQRAAVVRSRAEAQPGAGRRGKPRACGDGRIDPDAGDSEDVMWCDSMRHGVIRCDVIRCDAVAVHVVWCGVVWSNVTASTVRHMRVYRPAILLL